MRYRDGVVMENGSPRSSARVPPGFSLEFQAEVPATNKPGVKVDRSNPQMFLAVGGLYNALLARGRIEPGQTARVVVNRVFDAPPAYYWSGVPFKVAAEDLTARSPEHAFATARTTWKSLSAGVSRLTTPDDILNRIAAKAMLDGYFLTKRWNGHYIVFDSGCYPCQWDSCSTNWFYALDMMGDHATAARLLDTVFARQGQRKPAGMRTPRGMLLRRDEYKTGRQRRLLESPATAGPFGRWPSTPGWPTIRPGSRRTSRRSSTAASGSSASGTSRRRSRTTPAAACSMGSSSATCPTRATSRAWDTSPMPTPSATWACTRWPSCSPSGDIPRAPAC